jgi:hypothetical protein
MIRKFAEVQDTRSNKILSNIKGIWISRELVNVDEGRSKKIALWKLKEEEDVVCT